MNPCILISGASTGIGYAITHKAASLKYLVFAGYRKQKDKEKLLALGSNVRPIQLDVTSEIDIQTCIEVIQKEVGYLDVLINNAGIVVAGPLECLPLKTIREVFEVNVFGALALTQASIPLLKQSQNGKIFQISSISGRMTIPLLGPYCASKFALESLSDALRIELKSFGIQVCLIEPGSVKTPIWQKSHQRFQQLLTETNSPCFQQYQIALNRLEKLSKKAEANAIQVEKVANLLLTLIRKKKIPSRVVIGKWDAHLQVWAGKWLPDRWKDSLMAKILHLHQISNP